MQQKLAIFLWQAVNSVADGKFLGTVYAMEYCDL